MASHIAPPRAAGTSAATEDSLSGLLSQTAVLTRRSLILLVRNPMTIVFALLLPVLFLLTIDVVLGNSVEIATGEKAIYRSAPLVTLVAAMLGSAVGMVGIIDEQLDGFLNRLWVLPLHRGAGLLGRLFAEVIRLTATTLVILGVAIILGFRFQQGPVAALLWLAVPVIFGVAFAIAVNTAALYWPKALLVDAIQPLAGLGLALCVGLVPLDLYPNWIQPVVRYQPMSVAVETMLGLSVGGPLALPMLGTLAWFVGIVAVCLLPLILGYRRASTIG